jgi:hypothetical protein
MDLYGNQIFRTAHSSKYLFQRFDDVNLSSTGLKTPGTGIHVVRCHKEGSVSEVTYEGLNPLELIPCKCIPPSGLNPTEQFGCGRVLV